MTEIYEQMLEQKKAFLTNHLLIAEQKGELIRAKNIREELNQLNGVSARLEIEEEEKGMLESD